jgi:hypothetical protein
MDHTTRPDSVDRLSGLVPGDEIEVRLDDGTVADGRVVRAEHHRTRVKCVVDVVDRRFELTTELGADGWKPVTARRARSPSDRWTPAGEVVTFEVEG